MTECYQTSLRFPRVSRRRVEADFTGGDISSDGGVLLLRQGDEKVGLTRALSKTLADSRRRGRCAHSQRDLLLGLLPLADAGLVRAPRR